MSFDTSLDKSLDDSSQCSPTSIIELSVHDDQESKRTTSALSLAVNNYGYEEISPSTQSRVGRRSSLKGSNGPSSTRRRHTITFCEHVMVTPIVPAADLAKKKSDLWLQSRDYDRILKKAYAIADRAAEGNQPNYCTRGLEALLVDQAETGLTVYDACNAVLEEQWNQAKEGISDDSALSKVYRISALKSKAEAERRAQNDEKDAMKYTMDTRHFCRRVSV
eukprot:scaffold1157_cov122-Cylindrotheca_fusiformis.AAC.1